MLKHAILVVYGFARRQGCNGFDGKLSILETKIPDVVADSCLLGIAQTARSLGGSTVAGFGWFFSNGAQ